MTTREQDAVVEALAAEYDSVKSTPLAGGNVLLEVYRRTPVAPEAGPLYLGDVVKVGSVEVDEDGRPVPLKIRGER